MNEKDLYQVENCIAVIGMAGRFPGAGDVDAFWKNLSEGVESISFFSDEELDHIDPKLRKNPSFVKARGILDDVDQFDAGFFGLTPREAGMTDPQQRLFLECAWSVLEKAGYNPDTHGGGVGVFAGCDDSTYRYQLRTDQRLVDMGGSLPLNIGNNVDHFAPRTSYFLNLRGPSVPIQTACSTSLVAIHMACQSLLHFECDMALSGGASIETPVKGGYLYEEGGVSSPDGHCRAFDADANGTTQGSAVGVVLLKRLEDALADGDHIHAIVRGSAINNDGSGKIGYTAPSVEGQRRVVEEAMALAGVSPADVSYIETHGTGTPLGDPIEIEALRQVYGEAIDGKPHVALGAVKTNVGHCNSAAGVVGLIKTVLCLEHKTMVPTVHFKKPNPKTQMEGSPFYVNTETRSWDADQRIAGLSSFGIGGTNAHMILQQAPEQEKEPSTETPWHMATLSAKTPGALQTRRDQLREYLEANPDVNLGDLAYTLNVGRKAMDFRGSIAFSTQEEAIKALTLQTPAQNFDGKRTVVFMFPGQGADYLNFGAELYEGEAVFRDEVDACCKILQPILGLNLADYLFAGEGSDARARLKEADLWQPAIFTVEYALAKTFMARGIEPEAMIGHSIGEFVAATLAGVYSLEEGLKLIARRGQGVRDLERGGMIAVVQDEASLSKHLSDEVSLAAVNGPSLCVLSGTISAIDAVEARLKEEGVQVIRLKTDHAFHSHMMEPVMEPLAEMAAGFDLKAPEIPFISNLTGAWMAVEDATDPKYWAKHMRCAVRFSEGLETLFEEPGRIFLEVGPGKVLTNLVKRHPDGKAPAVNGMPPKDESAMQAFYEALGGLWAAGLNLDWETYYGDAVYHRLSLPTYPFEHRSYWIDPIPQEGRSAAQSLDERLDIDDWFFLPVWRQHAVPRLHHGAASLEADKRWLIFLDEGGYAEALAVRLEELHQKVVRVKQGDSFEVHGDNLYSVSPGEAAAYDGLVESLISKGLPEMVVHAWRMDPCTSTMDQVDAHLDLGYKSLLYLAQAIAGHQVKQKIQINVLTTGVHSITGESLDAPEKTCLIGAAYVLPKEFANLPCRAIDTDTITLDAKPDMLIAEMAKGKGDVVAFRNNIRWEPIYEPLHLEPDFPRAAFREGGVYVITHALQEMGFALATYLGETYKAHVIMLDRSFFPRPEEWNEWLEEQGEDDAVSQRIIRIRAMRERGVNLQVHTVDPASKNQMSRIFDTVRAETGPIRGVFHLDRPSETGLIQTRFHTDIGKVLSAKLREALCIAELTEGLDFLVLSSENLAEGGIGKSEQCAAYMFLGRFARELSKRLDIPVVGIEWGPRTWQEEELATAMIGPEMREQLGQKFRVFGINQEEFIVVLERALNLEEPHVIVSTREFQPLMDEQVRYDASYFTQQENQHHDSDGKFHPRPETLSTAYEEPRNDVERTLADVWQRFFEIEKVGVNDNFFEMGGHSLMAVQLLATLNETFSTNLVLKLLFEAPTIAEFAEAITSEAVEVEDAEAMEALLAEIEGLSADELSAILETEADA